MRTSHFGMFLGPAIFDGQVLAFDEATFLQPHVETGHLQREGIGRGAVQKPDHRHPRLLRARPSGHAAAAPPRCVMNARCLMSDMGPPAQELTEPCCRTLSLPQRGRQVIEADLNCLNGAVGGRP